jgi:hypothetical protein
MNYECTGNEIETFYKTIKEVSTIKSLFVKTC